LVTDTFDGFLLALRAAVPTGFLRAFNFASKAIILAAFLAARSAAFSALTAARAVLASAFCDLAVSRAA